MFLTDLLYSTLEILNMLACSANFLAVYILCTVKICGEYLAVMSHFFEFSRLTPFLILALFSKLSLTSRETAEISCL